MLKTLCVLDFDDLSMAEAFEGEHPELGRAPMETTRKGRHYFFKRSAMMDAQGYYDGARQMGGGYEVDFKTRTSTGTGGLVVVAPSPGKEWVRPPWEWEPFELPESILVRVAKPKHAQQLRGMKAKVPAAAIQKDSTLAGSMEVGELLGRTKDPVERLLLLLSKTRWEDRTMWRDIATALKNEYGGMYQAVWDKLSRMSSKYNAKDAAATWESVARSDYAGPRVGMGTLHKWAREDDPLGYAEYRASVVPPVVLDNWDKEDYGLAVVARHLLNDRIKRTGVKTQAIYYFDEGNCRWRAGTEASLHQMIILALEEVLRDVDAYLSAKARAESDDAQRSVWDNKKRVVSERLRYIRKHGGICNVTAEALPLFQDDTFEQRLDSKAHLLGVKNGVVDLRTGELRERNPEDMVFTVLDVAYDPGASTADMEEMVLSCMAGDAAMAAFLQKLWGYGITGETCEEVFVVFTGSGRNGKGGLTQTVSKVMGNFFKAMNSGLICERQVSNVDAERGKLLGARLAVFDELRAGEKLKTHEVQLLSGGDGIPARPLYKDPVTITPRHLCILSTNHLPELTEVIPAIVLRLLIVHFPVTFTDLLEGEAPTAERRQADHGLKRRLESNQAGVLRWLVQGAMAWYAQPGMRRHAPAKVLEFSRQYFEEQDRIAGFLSARCKIGVALRVSTKVLRLALNDYLAEACADLLDERGVASAMKSKGFTKKRGWYRGENVQCFEGLDLKTE